jgi:hypothetical protein
MGVFDHIEVAEPIGERLPNYDAARLGTPTHEAD